MVVVTLRGGLGNQLFQYATGRAVALRTGSELRLDLSDIGNQWGPDITERPLHLNAFDLSADYFKIAGGGHLRTAIYDKLGSILWFVSKDAAVKFVGIYKDDDTCVFDHRVLELPGNIHLDGYWQSEKYFQPYADVLRDEISVQNPPVGKNRDWYEQIESANSLSIHVRRGDYVNLDRVLPPEYYHRALQHITKTTVISDVFVFSDDMQWVREHRHELIPNNPEFDLNYVDCNDGSTAHEDLRLMRACDHHIVANSTFSWWGAWLNEADSKRVIAPDYWIQDDATNLDIVPERWEKVGW